MGEQLQAQAKGGTVSEPPDKVLAFLIADVRGYTSFTRERGDAAAAMLAKKFADLAREAVAARSGAVLELRGDEALAVFASTAQAVRAAVEFQATCAEESRLEPAFQLPVGIGIDAGVAIPVEDGYRGVALNMAARMCSGAAAGQVLVTRTVVDRSGSMEDVVFADRGMATFKGFDAPTEVIEALSVTRPADDGAAHDGPARAAMVVPTLVLPPELDSLTPLIDRDTEMQWLRGSWRQARRGRGRVLFVSGPPQIGKTRLAAALAADVHASGADVLYAGPGGAGTAMALAAIRDALRAKAPTLVVLDDIDIGGPSEAEALTSAYGPFGSAPILVVGLLRDTGASPELASLIERADQRGDGHRHLGALDLEGIRDIVRLYAGEDVDDAPVESMARSSGGVPGKVHELASDWARSEASRRLAASAEWLASTRDRRSADLRFANNVIALKLGRLYTVEGRDVPPEEGSGGCPYRGLAAFEAADAAYFFGRERLVGELAARTVQSGLLSIVGPSGSGKSSLISAGLLPSLAAGLLPGSERWRQVRMRPGEHPLLELGAALGVSPHPTSDRGDVATVIERATGAEPLVLVVDQFEEVFTTCIDDGERRTFIAEVTAAAERRDRVVVVLGIRSDFYGHCAPYPDLAALLAANTVLVGPMTQEELRRAIELPARRTGLRIETALTDALVEEIGDEPGALPLLSTALVELWSGRENGWIRVGAHERTGGVQGAVARLAESSFEQLTEGQREAARRVLLRLVAIGEGESVTRRRVPIEEFDLGRDTLAEAVISRLTEDRLLTRSDGTVEVAHEALLREWPRLREWLEEDSQGRQLRLHITQTARQWGAAENDASELYRGARLSAALDWSAEHAAELNNKERDFLAASRQASDRETDRQRRVNRRLRGLLVGVATLLIVALVAGSLALVQRSRAQRAATVSLANTLGADGINQPRLDRGLLLAREAMNLQVSDQTKSNLLWTVLRNPQQVGAIYFGDTGKRPQHIALSPDGKILAVSFNENDMGFYDASTLKQLALVPNSGGPLAPLAFANRSPLFATFGNEHGDVRLIDTRTFAVGRLIRFHDEYSNPNYNFHLTGLFFSPDDQTLWWGLEAWPPNVFSTSVPPRSVIESYSVASGRLTRHVVVDNDWQFGFAPIADGSELAVVDRRGVFVYDARTARLIRTIPLHGFGQADLRLPVALSSDGGTIAIGRDDGSVDFVSLASGRVSVAAGGHSGPVVNLTFTPDGSRLVTVGDDDRVVVWDVASRSVDQTLLGHGGAVHGVATDDRTLFTSSLDGTVFAWDLSQTRSFGERFAASSGDELGDPVDSPAPYFALSPDGRTLAAPETDGRVIMWDISTSPPRRVRSIDAGVPGGIPSISFSPDGATLVAGDLHGDVVLVDVSTGARRTLSSFKNPIAAVAFSPDGTLVAATDQYCFPCSGHLGLWNVVTGRLVHPLMKLPGYGNDIAFSPDGSLLAVPVGGPTDVIDARTWKLTRQVKLDADTYSVFSPNGRLLATTGGSGLVRLWDTRSWKELGQPFQASAGFGLSLSFDPTGRLLATGGTDATARIFDVSDPAGVTPFGPPQLPSTNGWTSARFTPNGAAVVVLDESGRAWVWPMRWQDWAAHACSVAGRQLSRAEWSEFLGGKPYASVCPR
jgi:WD40 repeat protein/class 3 adenylate cyclase